MPKVEEILKREQASKKWVPRDSIGNEIHEGDFLCIGHNANGPIFCRVLKIELGGLHTVNGVIPTRVLWRSEGVFLQGEGQWIGLVAKVPNPASEQLVSAAMDGKIKVD